MAPRRRPHAHSVALKFLPAGVTADADRLAQFHAELRIARQVSHKNVCRLYDLGDADGRRFTGRRAYEAKTLNELVALQQSGTISTPSSVVRDLDPAIERVILRCLERDPALRPGSALAVSAALPAGHPLAAAL